MGIAAYNRGSNAIRMQLEQESAKRKVVATYPCEQVNRKPSEDPLPEGVLRSTFLPDNDLAGTRIFLSYKKGWYLIHTNFQNLKRRRKIQEAIRLFENVDMFGLVALWEDKR